MDDRTDIAMNYLDKKYGILPDCDCDGDCELAFIVGGEVSHYKDKWEKIADDHCEGCPVGIAADKKQISSLCLCKELAEAEKWSQEDEEKWDRKLEKGE